MNLNTLRKSLILGLFCALTLALVSDALAARRWPGRERGWELLGARTVTDKVDHDSVAAADQGTFRSLKIVVEGRAVQFRDVKVHFAHGGVQHVELRNVIPAGGASRVIDIEGRDRVIRRVEFWYDAQSILGQRATVRVYGRN